MLRRGLRPLEHIATSSRAIAAGDLSRRVGPESGATEIVELGTALNVMLSAIEKAFAEREATEARLRQFLADASHELRTPLTSIQGFAELFRIGVDSEHVDEATIIRRIEDEAGRMKRLVEDLLTLARLDQAPAMVYEPVDLAVVAADACSDAVAAAPDRPISLDAPEPLVLLGDKNHLQQAMANLVTNAIGHTPPGTAIEVSARADGGQASLSVRDHGRGLEPEALDKAFERFWQADQARAGSGAGLGLAIVSAIAAEHGGTATVANAPGGGGGVHACLAAPAGAFGRCPVAGGTPLLTDSPRTHSAGLLRFSQGGTEEPGAVWGHRKIVQRKGKRHDLDHRFHPLDAARSCRRHASCALRHASRPPGTELQDG
jgi:two-component system OmpR family sensor kinase